MRRIQITYKLAMAAGRIQWNEADYRLAAHVTADLLEGR